MPMQLQKAAATPGPTAVAAPVAPPAGPAGTPLASNGHMPPPAGANGAPATVSPAFQKLQAINEQTWMSVGSLADMVGDHERAIAAYESALRHNPYSTQAMSAIANILRSKEQFAVAVDYYQRILTLTQESGETWGSLGHCYLMMDDLQKAYTAYQQALYHLRDPKEPKLWYGIGILYDRYGSLEYAEEAFTQVMEMDPKFEKANEIYFRLGIIYKQQMKHELSLQCFKYILHNPPRPLTEIDIWFQIGHVYEQRKDYKLAKEAYERVLIDDPNHAKVLQQLGWLYHQQNSSFANQDLAITYLTKSLEADPQDAQSWYLLGRCYMAQQKYNKAYEAYQQAVYREGRNPTFWCSIGVLYYQINQYRDALDAYSRAIRLNPYISEVWYDLGTLYESCNNQLTDALDAYQRAADLDPSNTHIQARLEQLRAHQQNGGTGQAPMGANPAGAVPRPQDVNPQAYQQDPTPRWNGQPAPAPANASRGGPPTSLPPHQPPPPAQPSSQQPPPPAAAPPPTATSRGPVLQPMQGQQPAYSTLHHGPPQGQPGQLPQFQPGSQGSHQQQLPPPPPIQKPSTAPTQGGHTLPPPVSGADYADSKDGISGPPAKRQREWEDDEHEAKKNASDENKARAASADNKIPGVASLYDHPPASGTETLPSLASAGPDKKDSANGKPDTTTLPSINAPSGPAAATPPAPREGAPRGGEAPAQGGRGLQLRRR
ncbi:glucose repression mediator protein [Dipodascopsis tothii]|uniref:glucose repression mediator protein n=1 Tax=Dipodascopsis tothii TaxID=44089 RepID=UPI0034CD3499